MQISVSLGFTLKVETVVLADISNVKHSLDSVLESLLIGMDTHCSSAFSVIVTSPLLAVYIVTCVYMEEQCKYIYTCIKISMYKTHLQFRLMLNNKKQFPCCQCLQTALQNRPADSHPPLLLCRQSVVVPQSLEELQL